MNWDRYTLLVAASSSPATRTTIDDNLGEGGKRDVVELTLSVYVDLYCQRCDTEIAALEPDDVQLDDVLSVICAHEETCVPAPSWGHA